MNCWELLGIEPTTDPDAIRRAFAVQSKLHHPEDDPETFGLLRNAYLQALWIAKTGHYDLFSQTPDDVDETIDEEYKDDEDDEDDEDEQQADAGSNDETAPTPRSPLNKPQPDVLYDFTSAEGLDITEGSYYQTTFSSQWLGPPKSLIRQQKTRKFLKSPFFIAFSVSLVVIIATAIITYKSDPETHLHDYEPSLRILHDENFMNSTPEKGKQLFRYVYKTGSEVALFSDGWSRQLPFTVKGKTYNSNMIGIALKPETGFDCDHALFTVANDDGLINGITIYAARDDHFKSKAFLLFEALTYEGLYKILNGTEAVKVNHSNKGIDRYEIDIRGCISIKVFIYPANASGFYNIILSPNGEPVIAPDGTYHASYILIGGIFADYDR
jgi:hypothetical protein